MRKRDNLQRGALCASLLVSARLLATFSKRRLRARGAVIASAIATAAKASGSLGGATALKQVVAVRQGVRVSGRLRGSITTRRRDTVETRKQRGMDRAEWSGRGRGG